MHIGNIINFGFRFRYESDNMLRYDVKIIPDSGPQILNGLWKTQVNNSMSIYLGFYSRIQIISVRSTRYRAERVYCTREARLFAASEIKNAHPGKNSDLSKISDYIRHAEFYIVQISCYTRVRCDRQNKCELPNSTERIIKAPCPKRFA